MAHRLIRGELPIDIPALVDIARDQHPRIVIQKSAQIGLTELVVNRALHAADTGYAGRGNVLFLMPTQSQVADFAASRFDVAIQDSAYLRARLQPEPPRRKAADNLHQKQLGQGRIFLRGAEGSRQVASIDADLVILDEFDQMREGTLERAEKRLASSRQPCLIVLSTPRLPEAGINGLYLESDQRCYYIPCQACGEEQTAEWEANVDTNRACVVCRRCRQPMNVLAQGRWIATAPENAAIHGYFLNRLFSPWANIPAMIEASQATTPLALQEFYNSDLGQPFVPPGGGLNIKEIDACRGNYELTDYAGESCVMGVDVGLKLHVVIRELAPRRDPRVWRPEEKDPFSSRLWFAGEVQYADLEPLMERFNVMSCVIDIRPEWHKTPEFAANSPSNVYVADYTRHEPGHEVVEGRPPKIRAHRTEMMDQVVARFRDGRVSLPREARSLGGRLKEGYAEYYREIMAPKRILITDSRGNLDARWAEAGRDDHYFHAEVYALLAEFVGERNRIWAA